MAATSKYEAVITPYVLYFNESVRGLSIGAPVTVAGLPVGEVTDVSFEYDSESNDVRPQVDIVLYPARFIKYLKKSSTAGQAPASEGARRAFIQRMVDRGYRAQLRSGNLVMGQLYVAFDRFPHAPKAKKIDWRKTPHELPVIPSSLGDLETRVSNIIAKIDKMPLDTIGEDLKKTLETLNRTLKDADKMLNHIDNEMVPEIKTAVQELRKTLAAAERTLKSADNTLVGKDSPTQQELRVALQEVARAARSISALVDYLERNPNALIRGKAQEVPQ